MDVNTKCSEMPKKAGRPTIDAEGPQTHQLQARVSKEFLAKLDEWRRAQPDIPTRTEALRRLVEQALSAPKDRGRK